MFWIRVSLWLSVAFFGWQLWQQNEAATPIVATPVTETILVVGDTGSGMTAQRQVAQQMTALCATKKSCSQMWLLGDIIYPTGQIDVYGDSRFKAVYEPLFRQGVRVVTALGNHDLYEKKPEDIPGILAFYHMPQRYYQLTAAKGAIEAFVLDTNVYDATQAQWLEKALKASKAPVKIVLGHHPIFSSGAHGADADLKVLDKTLRPLLERYGVRAYLAGHDHNYERFAALNGVQYVVSGGGGASLRDMPNVKPPQKGVRPESLIHQSIHHFIALQPQYNAKTKQWQLLGQVINVQGDILDRFSL